jgi:hypothetical protein
MVLKIGVCMDSSAPDLHRRLAVRRGLHVAGGNDSTSHGFV